MNDSFIIKVPKRSLGRNFAPKQELGNEYVKSYRHAKAQRRKVVILN
jgi:hypothetical protein